MILLASVGVLVFVAVVMAVLIHDMEKHHRR